jgi:hypothetical protein
MTTIYDQFPQFRRADANQNDAMAHRKKKKKQERAGRNMMLMLRYAEPIHNGCLKALFGRRR